MLHFGSSVGALVRSVLPTKLNPEVYVACGAAAAISAGFGAPIAGVVFACEAILRHFSVRALAPIVVSSTIASASTRLFFDRSSPYIVDVSGVDWTLLPLVQLLGSSSALVAVLFMSSLLKVINWAKQQNRELLLLLIAATGMALIGSAVPEALGLGTNTVNEFLSGERMASDVALILVAKFIATLLCLGFGLFGGVFLSRGLHGGEYRVTIRDLSRNTGLSRFRSDFDGSLWRCSGYGLCGWGPCSHRDHSFGVY